MKFSIFCTIFLATISASAQQLAITFDDLPVHGPLPPGETRQHIATSILETFRTNAMPPVYGFINGTHTQSDPATISVLEAWRKAGNPLGNHTWSHINLDQNTPAAFEADTLRNEPLLKQLAGNQDWHWLRYPYLAEGTDPAKRQAVRTFLAQHHYKVAAVTMSFGDYAWNDPYARCMAQNDTAAIATLEHSYLEAATQDATHARAMAHAALGHDIPYVLLMHIGAFDARMLPRLLAQYKQQGFTFVTLPQAESDPFYASSLDPTLTTPDTLEAALKAKGLPPIKGEGLPPMLETICR